MENKPQKYQITFMRQHGFYWNPKKGKFEKRSPLMDFLEGFKNSDVDKSK